MNKCIIEGIINGDIRFSHKFNELSFYEFTLESKRTSGVSDYIECIVPEWMLDEDYMDKAVHLEGEIRTRNVYDVNSQKKLNVFLFVKKIDRIEPKEEYINKLSLRGFLCKEPSFRKTPMGKYISDIIIAVNSKNNKSYYIPCIAWNSLAKAISNKNIGDEIFINTRFQSREYTKLVDGIEETRIVYEASIYEMEEM